MPVKPSHYPRGWRLFSAQIRFARAKGRCECTGECGLHAPNPAPRRCLERHDVRAIWFRGRVKLAVAHVCACSPICLEASHVKAMCQRCHVRVDGKMHAGHRVATQRQSAQNPRVLTRPPGEPGWPGCAQTKQALRIWAKQRAALPQQPSTTIQDDPGGTDWPWLVHPVTKILVR